MLCLRRLTFRCAGCTLRPPGVRPAAAGIFRNGRSGRSGWSGWMCAAGTAYLYVPGLIPPICGSCFTSISDSRGFGKGNGAFFNKIKPYGRISRNFQKRCGLFFSTGEFYARLDPEILLGKAGCPMYEEQIQTITAQVAGGPWRSSHCPLLRTSGRRWSCCAPGLGGGAGPAASHPAAAGVRRGAGAVLPHPAQAVPCPGGRLAVLLLPLYPQHPLPGGGLCPGRGGVRRWSPLLSHGPPGAAESGTQGPALRSPVRLPLSDAGGVLCL